MEGYQQGSGRGMHVPLLTLAVHLGFRCRLAQGGAPWGPSRRERGVCQMGTIRAIECSLICVQLYGLGIPSGCYSAGEISEPDALCFCNSRGL